MQEKIQKQIDEICENAIIGGEYTRLDEFDAGLNNIEYRIDRMEAGNYSVSETLSTLHHLQHLSRVAPSLRKKLVKELENKCI